MEPSRVILAGSSRPPIPGAQVLGPVDPAERLELTVVLRRGSAGHGADVDDVELVQRVFAAAGVEVIEVDAPTRRVRVGASAGVLAALFGAELQRARTRVAGAGEAVEHRYREGSLSLPAELADVVIAVLGLDNRPQARTHIRPAAAAGTSYTPLELAAIYRLPPGTDGTGQTLAIIELGGGFAESDLDVYFTGLGLAVPSVTAVGVDGATNVAGQDPKGADGEVLLDIEVAGAIAPKAGLLVYFAPNTDAGFLDAVSQAAHAQPTPTAISISWGQSEDEWTEQARQAMDLAFADAVALGVTVTAAAGDNGSADAQTTEGKVHVDFPASSPHVLACGGTSLRADPQTGVVTSEKVWNDGSAGGATGGGVSDCFPLPTWQAHAGVPVRSGAKTTGRGVPDVAANADPQTGYQVYVDGSAVVFGGTSAVAPLWAALVCRLAQALGTKLGQLQPVLYDAVKPGAARAGLRDITSGDNGAYRAKAGWDACTGLGVPDGVSLLAALRAKAAGKDRQAT